MLQQVLFFLLTFLFLSCCPLLGGIEKENDGEELSKTESVNQVTEKNQEEALRKERDNQRLNPALENQGVVISSEATTTTKVITDSLEQPENNGVASNFAQESSSSKKRAIVELPASNTSNKDFPIGSYFPIVSSYSVDTDELNEDIKRMKADFALVNQSSDLAQLQEFSRNWGDLYEDYQKKGLVLNRDKSPMRKNREISKNGEISTALTNFFETYETLNQRIFEKIAKIKASQSKEISKPSFSGQSLFSFFKNEEGSSRKELPAIKKESFSIKESPKEEESREALEEKFTPRLDSLKDAFEERKKSLKKQGFSFKQDSWQDQLFTIPDTSLKKAEKELEKSDPKKSAIELFLEAGENALKGLECLSEKGPEFQNANPLSQFYALLADVLLEKGKEESREKANPFLLQHCANAIRNFEQAIIFYENNPLEKAALSRNLGVAYYMLAKRVAAKMNSHSIRPQEDQLLKELKKIAEDGVQNWQDNSIDPNKTTEQCQWEAMHYDMAFWSYKKALNLVLTKPEAKEQEIAKLVQPALFIIQAASISTMEEATTDDQRAGIAYFEAKLYQQENSGVTSEEDQAHLQKVPSYYKEAGDCFANADKTPDAEQKAKWEREGFTCFQLAEEMKKSAPEMKKSAPDP